MDPHYKSRFNDAILAEAARRYGTAPESFEALDGFESFIYAFDAGGAAPSGRILRIGHSNRRPDWMVRGEAEWINYLYENGLNGASKMSVARPVLSKDGQLVETLEDGQDGQFIITAFEKAPGGHANRYLIETEIETWGALLGRTHALSVDYHPRWPRPHFDDPRMMEVERVLPAGEAGVLARFQELREAFAALPRSDPRHYGMIHQDAHGGNFFIDEGGVITLFDFDDCCCSWYANDIAIVFFYASMGVDPVQFRAGFVDPFLRGYRREKAISDEWLATIPCFLKLREIDLYAAIHRSFDVDNLDDPWVKRYMEGRKERIEAGVPYLDPVTIGLG